MDTDLYAILQVAPHAEPEIIESAYKRLAKKYHPDVNRASDAQDRMKALNHAYEILSDPAKRKQYDLKRESSRAAQSQPASRPAPAPSRPSTPKASPSSTPKGESKRGSAGEDIYVPESLLAKAIELSKINLILTTALLQRRLGVDYPHAARIFAIL